MQHWEKRKELGMSFITIQPHRDRPGRPTAPQFFLPMAEEAPAVEPTYDATAVAAPSPVDDLHRT